MGDNMTDKLQVRGVNPATKRMIKLIAVYSDRTQREVIEAAIKLLEKEVFGLCGRDRAMMQKR